MSRRTHRPNDHLVEPMFAALDPRGEDGEPGAHPARRSGRIRRVLPAILLAAAVLALWWILFA